MIMLSARVDPAGVYFYTLSRGGRTTKERTSKETAELLVRLGMREQTLRLLKAMQRSAVVIADDGRRVERPRRNTGAEWSRWDELDLETSINDGDSITEIAMLLRRTEIEIREKAAERGLIVAGTGGRGVRQTRDDWYDVYCFARKHGLRGGHAREIIERYGSDRERAIREAQRLRNSHISRPGSLAPGA